MPLLPTRVFFPLGAPASVLHAPTLLLDPLSVPNRRVPAEEEAQPTKSHSESRQRAEEGAKAEGGLAKSLQKRVGE